MHRHFGLVPNSVYFSKAHIYSTLCGRQSVFCISVLTSSLAFISLCSLFFLLFLSFFSFFYLFSPFFLFFLLFFSLFSPVFLFFLSLFSPFSLFFFSFTQSLLVPCPLLLSLFSSLLPPFFSLLLLSLFHRALLRFSRFCFPLSFIHISVIEQTFHIAYEVEQIINFKPSQRQQ